MLLTLNAADVRAINVRIKRKPLLRNAARDANLPKIESD